MCLLWCVQEVAELKEKDILGVSSPTTGACGHSSIVYSGRNPLVSGTQHMYIALVSVAIDYGVACNNLKKNVFTLVCTGGG